VRSEQDIASVSQNMCFCPTTNEAEEQLLRDCEQELNDLALSADDDYAVYGDDPYTPDEQEDQGIIEYNLPDDESNDDAAFYD
jgi:hypothetical protein